MNTNKNLLMLVKMALVMAIYVAVTVSLAPISFGNIQFRVSEVLILLVFVDAAYILPLTLGCALANVMSSLGVVDIVFGSLATFIALVFMIVTKKMLMKNEKTNVTAVVFIASIWAAVVNGLIIGGELYYVAKLPFWLSAVEVAVGEFVVVSILGTVVAKAISSNEKVLSLFKIR